MPSRLHHSLCPHRKIGSVQTVRRHERLFLNLCSSYGLLALCLAAQPAFAQSAPKQRAQELFDEGLRLMKWDHCQDAIALFAESQITDPAAATLANLATCYARLGKTGSAYSTYKLAARAAILESKPDLQKRTDDAAATLAPSLTQLRVVPLGNGGLPEIKINGQPVEDVRRAIPLDPGENIIEATAPGHETWRRVLSAHGEGTLMVVEVPDLGALHQQPQPAYSMPPVQETKRTDLKPYAIAAAGVGALAVGVGTAFTFSALSKQNASDAYCEGSYCTQPGVNLRNQALDRAAIATWSVGFGLVSLGSATVLWFLSPSHTQEAHARTVHPWMSIGQSAAALGLEGRL